MSLYGAKLSTLAYTTGKKQLSFEKVEQSKCISRLRIHIHVECTIELLKQKQNFLGGAALVSLIKHISDGEYCTLLIRHMAY